MCRIMAPRFCCSIGSPRVYSRSGEQNGIGGRFGSVQTLQSFGACSVAPSTQAPEGAAGRLSSGQGVSAGLLVQVQSTRLYPPAIVRLTMTATATGVSQANHPRTSIPCSINPRTFLGEWHSVGRPSLRGFIARGVDRPGFFDMGIAARPAASGALG